MPSSDSSNPNGIPTLAELAANRLATKLPGHSNTDLLIASADLLEWLGLLGLHVQIAPDGLPVVFIRPAGAGAVLVRHPTAVAAPQAAPTPAVPSTPAPSSPAPTSPSITTPPSGTAPSGPRLLSPTELGPKATTPEMISQIKAMGYSGQPCDFCGSMRTRYAGKCLLCEECKTTTGCS